MPERQPAPTRVWVLNHSAWGSIRLFATEQLARATAEKYVYDEAKRQPIGRLEWRRSNDEHGGYTELWGNYRGEMFPSNLVCYPLDVEQPPTAPAATPDAA